MQHETDRAALAIEASADAASVAVMRGGAVIATAEHEAQHGHAARLMGLVAESLAAAGLTMADIGIVLGGRGPGSFTGVRVALAAVKGLLAARGDKCAGYGIGSLSAVAHAHHDGGGEVIILGETRRKGLVFVERYPAHDGLPRLMDMGDAAALVQKEAGKKIIGNIAGDGIGADIIHAAPHAKHLLDYFHAMQKARTLPTDMALAPFYLTEPLLGMRK